MDIYYTRNRIYKKLLIHLIKILSKDVKNNMSTLIFIVNYGIAISYLAYLYFTFDICDEADFIFYGALSCSLVILISVLLLVLIF